MGTLSRILSIGLLVVHLMVCCCCSDRARGCEGKPCSSPIHSGAASDKQNLRCGCDHSHHGTQACQGAKCSLVSPRRIVGGSFIRLFQASFAALPDGQLARAAIGSRQHSPAAGHLLLPVRLHLANRVLLI